MDKRVTPQKGEIVIYSAEDGKTKLEVNLAEQTVWLSQRQMSELFEKNIMTINEHIKNVFAERELEEQSTIRESRIVRKEGKRKVRRTILLYNLDVTISVRRCPMEFWTEKNGWLRKRRLARVGNLDLKSTHCSGFTIR